MGHVKGDALPVPLQPEGWPSGWTGALYSTQFSSLELGLSSSDACLGFLFFLKFILTLEHLLTLSLK